jgi:hypothetical protein
MSSKIPPRSGAHIHYPELQQLRFQAGTRQILEIRNHPRRGTAPIVHSGTGVSSIGQESFPGRPLSLGRYRSGRVTGEGRHLVESNLRFMHG